MAIHLLDEPMVGLPPEAILLSELVVRPIREAERTRFDELLATKHYLKNARVVGRAVRYIAEYKGKWVALLVFNSAAYHLKAREHWLRWSARQVVQRRHLLAQNSRFLVLVPPARCPNLGSRVLSLACARLARDWQEAFGLPVLAVETFVDSQRFRGTCYRAAGWQALGLTQGYGRVWRDFYTDTQHPKELWVRALGPDALALLRSEELPTVLAQQEPRLSPACPVATEHLGSLWEHFREWVKDPRKKRGKRHGLATVLSTAALAVSAGCRGLHAIFEFAASLNHGQRRQLRCWPRTGHPRQYDVPSERTFRRVLKKVDSDEIKTALVAWMQQQDPRPLEVLHLDGKVVKNAEPAPPWRQAPSRAEPSEIPPELQKPKADKALTLVNFITSEQRLVDQIAVPQDTNEEAAVAAHFPKMDLAGVCVTADAAHTTKANCRQLTVEQGGDYLFILKGNQPHALAKAEQLLPGAFPPSG